MAAIQSMGWGSDPLDSSMFTSRRKSGRPMVHQLIKEKNADELYEVHLSAAKELKSYGHFITAARLMALILELHSLTIFVGYSEGYTAYWGDWLEVKRLKPIGDDPDPKIVTARIVSRMGKALTGGGTGNEIKELERRVLASEQRAKEAEQREKQQADQVNALRSQMGDLRKQITASEPPGGKPVGCFKCGSPDHRVQDCPLNKKSNPKAPEGAGSSDAEKEKKI